MLKSFKKAIFRALCFVLCVDWGGVNGRAKP